MLMEARELPVLTVDVVIRKDEGFVFVKRGKGPFKGYWALPGGVVEYGETVEAAALREAREETGLEIKLKRLVGVYSEPDRDPRGHFVSVAFLADAVGGELRAGSDAAAVKVFRTKPSPLAFDHDKIFDAAVSGVKNERGE